MRIGKRWLVVLVAIPLAAFVTAFLVDRLLLTPACSPCHSERTRALPLFKGAPSDELVRISANSFHFRARVAGFGNAGGEGVILLHGYPETSIIWQPTLTLLAQNGFRVVAFDQRGYSPAARPGSTPSYAIEELVSDVIAVADAVGFDRFHLVGHDWGGVVGWNAAYRHPVRVATWTSLSMPHPAAFREAIAAGGDQLLRSSYAVLHLIPGLAEFVLRFNRAAYYRRYSWSLMTASQREEYLDVFTEPGALRGVLNWYRANNFFSVQDVGPARQPTLYMWGHHDKALGRIGADKTADYVKGPFRYIKLSAGHKLMAERPDRVSREILSHLTNWTIKDVPKPSLPRTSDARSKDAACAPSKPHCLQIVVSPSGKFLRIENRCAQPYRGTLTVRCTGWQDGASVVYKFELGAGGLLLQQTQGQVSGDCYYEQSVCLARQDETAGR